MRTTGRARRGTRAATACRWRQRVVPRDAGHRGQRVLSRLSGRERGTFASRLVQFAITRVAVPRRANGPDPEPPLGVHEHESSGDRREIRDDDLRLVAPGEPKWTICEPPSSLAETRSARP